MWWSHSRTGEEKGPHHSSFRDGSRSLHGRPHTQTLLSRNESQEPLPAQSSTKGCLSRALCPHHSIPLSGPLFSVYPQKPVSQLCLEKDGEGLMRALKLKHTAVSIRWRPVNSDRREVQGSGLQGCGGHRGAVGRANSRSVCDMRSCPTVGHCSSCFLSGPAGYRLPNARPSTP